MMAPSVGKCRQSVLGTFAARHLLGKKLAGGNANSANMNLPSKLVDGNITASSSKMF